MKVGLPRILVVDDLFGRQLADAPNIERVHLCGKFLLRDVTSDEAKPDDATIDILEPVAEAVFCRGQVPVRASVGDKVENDLSGVLEKVDSGWRSALDGGRLPWAMVLIDLCFYTGAVTVESHARVPGMPVGDVGDDDPSRYFGLTILDAIHSRFPDLPVMILSSKQREEVSLAFSTKGALGFIARNSENGAEALRESLWSHGLLPDHTGEIVGHSLALLLALREARRAATHRLNLLIRGERGTGKELLARYLNNVSDRHGSRPFVAVNSAALSQGLFASELFGIQARTATGVEGKIGLIESANHGDLFLDEIADMPSEAQAAVLRVIQDRQVTRVGARTGSAIDVRFISATNIDIEGGALGFRSDLLDRLRLGGTLQLPSLRERREDIPLLAISLVKQAESQLGASRTRTITPEAMGILSQHDWPGNIRELQSVLFDAVSTFPDVEYLVPGHLRLKVVRHEPTKDHLDRSVGQRFRENQSPQKSGPLDQVIQAMWELDLSGATVGEWAGLYPEIEKAYQELMAKLLTAALEATKRRTLEKPEGHIQIHPAMKLLTGDSRLTASKAADGVKRILAGSSKNLDGILAEAYMTAVRLRPKSSR